MLPESLRDKTWRTVDGEITSIHLQGVLEQITKEQPRCAGIPGARGESDRRVDRATQLLKRAGLITFDKEKHRFVVLRS